MHRHSGTFVTVDGPNAVGKSSVVRGVAARLRSRGVSVHETSEPTTSTLGQLVRRSEESYAGRTYAALVAADRYHHLDAEVIPKLESNCVVISARYVESSLVLQRLDGVPLDLIWSLNAGVYIPDLTVILTASPTALGQRLSERSRLSRFEKSARREDELTYYLDAAEFLRQRRFNVVVLENELTPLDDTIAEVTRLVLDSVAGHRTVHPCEPAPCPNSLSSAGTSETPPSDER